MEEKNETFTYSYSSTQQEEIKRIRQKYLPPAEDKMEQLRRLDRSVVKPGTIASIATGTIGTLVFGVGICCTTVWSEKLFYVGVAVGIIGIIGIAAAYPLYIRITKKRREKLAPEIMRLSDELMK